MDPERTSPTAKIPGRLVSRKYGASPLCSARAPSWTSRPVSRNPCVVGGQLAFQPLGMRRSADEDEQRLGGDGAALSGARVGDGHRLELAVAAELDHLRVEADLDQVVALDLIDEIPRHRLRQITAPDQEPALRRVPGQEHRCLAGRVSAADDQDRIAGAELRLRLGGGVVDPAHLELVEARHVEAAVLRPGGDDHGAAGRHLAVRELDLHAASVHWSSASAAAGTARREPNLSAWTPARWASSLPDTPAGKPR